MIVKTTLENLQKRSPSLCLVFVMHKRVVKDSRVGRAAWVYSACCCAWRTHVVVSCNLIGMADVVCLVCRSYGAYEHAVLSLYGMLECEVCCDILLLLNMAHMVVLYVEGWCVTNHTQSRAQPVRTSGQKKKKRSGERISSLPEYPCLFLAGLA